ncbi:MAG: hypothetical protein ABI137_03815 [Antricoccus sp.]
MQVLGAQVPNWSASPTSVLPALLPVPPQQRVPQTVLRRRVQVGGPRRPPTLLVTLAPVTLLVTVALLVMRRWPLGRSRLVQAPRGVVRELGSPVRQLSWPPAVRVLQLAAGNVL